MLGALATKMFLKYYLGHYFNYEDIITSLWNGDVEITNLLLKPEAFNDLQLPVRVKAGYVGSVKIKVPMRRISKDPVVISVDRVYVVVEPPAQAVNLNRLIVPSATGSGYLAKTIIGNVKVSISNIDIVTVPCHIDNWEDLLPCEWDQVFSKHTQSPKESGDNEPLLKSLVKYFHPLMKPRFLEVLQSKTTVQRIRNDVLREYCEREAVGQMIPNLAEASRHFGRTDIVKDPSKFGLYRDCFVLPNQMMFLLTSRRVKVLQMNINPYKIVWEVPWEELMFANSGSSHLILHQRSLEEDFVRVIKCRSQYEAVRICSEVQKMWAFCRPSVQIPILQVLSRQRQFLREQYHQLQLP